MHSLFQPQKPPTVSLLRCSCLFLFITIALSGLVSGIDSVGKVADGELRSCQIVTVDQAWAVGDRGLILVTNDAGKTWTVQHQRSKATHYAVCFSNHKQGWVFGGTIEPYSHRSIGVVLTTNDGGRNWNAVRSLAFYGNVFFNDRGHFVDSRELPEVLDYLKKKLLA